MAGRNHFPPEGRRVSLSRVPLSHSNYTIGDSRILLHDHHHRTSYQSSSQALEDRINIQHREIQSLLVDNQRLAATHVALKQELAASQQELRTLSVDSANAKVELDAQVREVYERSLKMDAEVRAIDAMSDELAQVHLDIQKLGASRKELTAQLRAIEDDLESALSESNQMAVIKAEIDTLQTEIQKGRAAIEHEKKTRVSNLEQRQAMEKNMVSMARTLEKLHAELANAEKRARAAAAANPNPGHAATYGNSDMGYRGHSYPKPYGMHQPSVESLEIYDAEFT
ncbi:protein FLC EXPRESSOR isoform X1 [Ziziphus jujuba]|uniref:Protein FLC EXPRESSOR isoform X1 n=1 Tax=Ziziphus jujuba TaxID=326968 RepID=A0A6P6FWK0_ZIZJJ|nr:protein FLC EXPRESSOR isoform X1 [Ziziphus jujuba]